MPAVNAIHTAKYDFLILQKKYGRDLLSCLSPTEEQKEGGMGEKDISWKFCTVYWDISIFQKQQSEYLQSVRQIRLFSGLLKYKPNKPYL